jgi:hypothetical protein
MASKESIGNQIGISSSNSLPGALFDPDQLLSPSVSNRS